MLKLALKGGKPVAKDVKVPQWPVYDEKDKKAILEVLEIRKDSGRKRIRNSSISPTCFQKGEHRKSLPEEVLLLSRLW